MKIFYEFYKNIYLRKTADFFCPYPPPCAIYYLEDRQNDNFPVVKRNVKLKKWNLRIY